MESNYLDTYFWKPLDLLLSIKNSKNIQNSYRGYSLNRLKLYKTLYLKQV